MKFHSSYIPVYSDYFTPFMTIGSKRPPGQPSSQPVNANIAFGKSLVLWIPGAFPSLNWWIAQQPAMSVDPGVYLFKQLPNQWRIRVTGIVYLHLVHFSMVNVENNGNYLYLDPMGPIYSWLLHLKLARCAFMLQKTNKVLSASRWWAAPASHQTLVRFASTNKLRKGEPCCHLYVGVK